VEFAVTLVDAYRAFEDARAACVPKRHGHRHENTHRWVHRGCGALRNDAATRRPACGRDQPVRAQSRARPLHPDEVEARYAQTIVAQQWMNVLNALQDEIATTYQAIGAGTNPQFTTAAAGRRRDSRRPLQNYNRNWRRWWPAFLPPSTHRWRNVQ
jgi:hypothetical protein